MHSPRTPLDLPSFNLNYEKTTFCEKLDFSRFTNRSLALREEIYDVMLLVAPPGLGGHRGLGTRPYFIHDIQKFELAP